MKNNRWLILVCTWTGIRAKADDGKSAGFGFMLSPNAGTRLSERLKDGEKIKAHASVKVKTATPGTIEMVTAEIPGADPINDDVVLSAHLDHQPPGANDNASGSAALLEIARTVKSLVENGVVSSPPRTLRFWWVTEIQRWRKIPQAYSASYDCIGAGLQTVADLQYP